MRTRGRYIICFMAFFAYMNTAMAQKYEVRVGYNHTEDRINNSNSSDRGTFSSIYMQNIVITPSTAFITDSTYRGGTSKAGRGGDGVLAPYGSRVCKSTVPYKKSANANVDLSKLRSDKCFVISKNGNVISVNEDIRTHFTNSPTEILEHHDYSIYVNGGSCTVQINRFSRDTRNSWYTASDTRLSYGPTCSVYGE